MTVDGIKFDFMLGYCTKTEAIAHLLNEHDPAYVARRIVASWGIELEDAQEPHKQKGKRSFPLLRIEQSRLICGAIGCFLDDIQTGKSLSSSLVEYGLHPDAVRGLMTTLEKHHETDPDPDPELDLVHRDVIGNATFRPQRV